MQLDVDVSLFTVAKELCARDNNTLSRHRKEHIKACLNECRQHYDILTIVPTLRVVTSFHLAWLRLLSAVGGFDSLPNVRAVGNCTADGTGGPVYSSVYPPVAPTGLELHNPHNRAPEQD